MQLFVAYVKLKMNSKKFILRSTWSQSIDLAETFNNESSNFEETIKSKINTLQNNKNIREKKYSNSEYK